MNGGDVGCAWMVWRGVMCVEWYEAFWSQRGSAKRDWCVVVQKTRTYVLYKNRKKRDVTSSREVPFKEEKHNSRPPARTRAKRRKEKNAAAPRS